MLFYFKDPQVSQASDRIREEDEKATENLKLLLHEAFVSLLLLLLLLLRYGLFIKIRAVGQLIDFRFIVIIQDEIPLGTIPLTDVRVRPLPDKLLCFEIYADDGKVKSSKRSSSGVFVTGQHKNFVFSSESEAERDKWVKMTRQSLVITSPPTPPDIIE
jgi:hypothetical protein